MPAEPPPLTPLLLPLPLAIATTVVADAEYVAEPAIPARRPRWPLPCPALASLYATRALVVETELQLRGQEARQRECERCGRAGRSAAATRTVVRHSCAEGVFPENRLRAQTC